MRGKRAKEIRKAVYGNFSPQSRRYMQNQKSGQIIADPRRKTFQTAKKFYKLHRKTGRELAGLSLRGRSQTGGTSDSSTTGRVGQVIRLAAQQVKKIFAPVKKAA